MSPTTRGRALRAATAAVLATAALAACSGGTHRATPTDTTDPGPAASSAVTTSATAPAAVSASPSASAPAGPEAEAEGYRRRLVHDRPAPSPSGDVLRAERSGIVVGSDAGGRGATLRDVDDAGMPGSAFAVDVSCVGRGKVDVAVTVEHEPPMRATVDCGATNGEGAYHFVHEQDGRIGTYSVTVTPRATTVAGVLYRVVDPRESLTATPTR